LLASVDRRACRGRLVLAGIEGNRDREESGATLDWPDRLERPATPI
jgi:hypothetical protein